jgi:hypothetical protein
MDTNLLYYGDNLHILRRYIPHESVDLIYLDPPFNSNRSCNVIFKDESGRQSDAQLLAFEDTWHWGPTVEATYYYLTTTARHEGHVPDPVSRRIGPASSTRQQPNDRIHCGDDCPAGRAPPSAQTYRFTLPSLRLNRQPLPPPDP